MGIETRLKKAEARTPKPTVEIWITRTIIEPVIGPDGSMSGIPTGLVLRRKARMAKDIVDRWRREGGK